MQINAIASHIKHRNTDSLEYCTEYRNYELKNIYSKNNKLKSPAINSLPLRVSYRNIYLIRT